MINKKLAAIALTSLLLVGCGTDKETNANEPELQETSSIVEDTKDVKEKDVTSKTVELRFIGSLDPTDLINIQQNNTTGEDVTESEKYDMYKDMMAELSNLYTSDFNTEAVYALENDKFISYEPAATITPMDNAAAVPLNVSEYEYNRKMSEPQRGVVSVSSKTSPTGSQIYANNQAFDNGEIPEGEFGDSTYVLYENDEVFVYMSSNIIDRVEDENPQGDDLKDLFTSDEATAIYEKYIK